MIWRHVNLSFKLLLDKRLEVGHLGFVPMHENNLFRVHVPEKVDNPFRISMRREGNILNSHFD